MLFFSIMMLISILCPAQSKFQMGPTFGIGTSFIHWEKPLQMKPHIHGGVIKSYPINDKLYFQPSFVFSVKGYADAPVFPDDNMTLGYFDNIFNVKYFKSETFFVGGGLEIGILFYSHYKHLAYGTDYYDDSTLPDVMNKVDFGISGCLGWQFKSNVGIEISCIYGLRDIFNSKGDEPLPEGGYIDDSFYLIESVKGKNTVISGSFYYLIKKK